MIVSVKNIEVFKEILCYVQDLMNNGVVDQDDVFQGFGFDSSPDDVRNELANITEQLL